RRAAPDEFHPTCSRGLSELLDAGGNSLLRQTGRHVNVQDSLPRSTVSRDGLRSRTSAECTAAAAVTRLHPTDSERRILHWSSEPWPAASAARQDLLRSRRFSLEHASRMAILLA